MYTSNSEFDLEKRVQITNEVPPEDLFGILHSVLAKQDIWKWLIGWSNITTGISYTEADDDYKAEKIVNGTVAEDYGPKPKEIWDADARKYVEKNPTDLTRLEVDGVLMPEVDLFLHEIYRYFSTLYPDHPDFAELLTHNEVVDAFEQAAAEVDYKPNSEFFNLLAQHLDGTDWAKSEIKIFLRNLRDIAYRRKLYGSSLGLKMIASDVFSRVSIFPVGTYLPLKDRKLDGSVATNDQEIDVFDPRYGNYFRMIDWTATSNDKSTKLSDTLSFIGYSFPGSENVLIEYQGSDVFYETDDNSSVSEVKMFNNFTLKSDTKEDVDLIDANATKQTYLIQPSYDEDTRKITAKSSEYGSVRSLLLSKRVKPSYITLKLLGTKEDIRNLVKNASIKVLELKFANEEIESESDYLRSITDLLNIDNTYENLPDVEVLYNIYNRNTLSAPVSLLLEMYPDKAVYETDLDENTSRLVSSETLSPASFPVKAYFGDESNLYYTVGYNKGSIYMEFDAKTNTNIYMTTSVGQFSVEDPTILSQENYVFAFKNDNDEIVCFAGQCDQNWVRYLSGYRITHCRVYLDTIPNEKSASMMSVLYEDYDELATEKHSLEEKLKDYIEGSDTYEETTKRIAEIDAVIDRYKQNRSLLVDENGLSTVGFNNDFYKALIESSSYTYIEDTNFVDTGRIIDMDFGSISAVPILNSNGLSLSISGVEEKFTVEKFKLYEQYGYSQEYSIALLDDSNLDFEMTGRFYPSLLDDMFYNKFVDSIEKNSFSIIKPTSYTVDIECTCTIAEEDDSSYSTLSFETDDAKAKFAYLTVGDKIYGQGLEEGTYITEKGDYEVTISTRMAYSHTSVYTFELFNSRYPSSIEGDLGLYEEKLKDSNEHQNTSPWNNAFYGSVNWPSVAANAYLDGLMNPAEYEPYNTSQNIFQTLVKHFSDHVPDEGYALMPSFIKTSDLNFYEVNITGTTKLPNRQGNTLNLLNVEWLDYLDNEVKKATQTKDIVNVGAHLIMQTDGSGYYTLNSKNSYTDPDLHLLLQTFNWSEGSVPYYAQIGNGGSDRKSWFKSITDIPYPYVYGATYFDSNSGGNSVLYNDMLKNGGEYRKRQVYSKDDNSAYRYIDEDVNNSTGVESLVAETQLGEYNVMKNFDPGNGKICTVVDAVFIKHQYEDLSKWMEDSQKIKVTNIKYLENDIVQGTSTVRYSNETIDELDIGKIYLVYSGWDSRPEMRTDDVDFTSMEDFSILMYENSKWRVKTLQFGGIVSDSMMYSLSSTGEYVSIFPYFRGGTIEDFTLSKAEALEMGLVTVETATNGANGQETVKIKDGANISASGEYFKLNDSFTFTYGGTTYTKEQIIMIVHAAQDMLYGTKFYSGFDGYDVVDGVSASYKGISTVISSIDTIKNLWTYYGYAPLVKRVKFNEDATANTAFYVLVNSMPKLLNDSMLFTASIELTINNAQLQDELYCFYSKNNTVYFQEVTYDTTGRAISQWHSTHIDKSLNSLDDNNTVIQLPKTNISVGDYKFTFLIDPKFISVGYPYINGVPDTSKKVTFYISESSIKYDNANKCFYTKSSRIYDADTDKDIEDTDGRVEIIFKEQKFFKCLKSLTGQYQKTQSQEALSSKIESKYNLEKIPQVAFDVSDLSASDKIYRIDEVLLRPEYVSSGEPVMYSKYGIVSGQIYGVNEQGNLIISNKEEGSDRYIMNQTSFANDVDTIWPVASKESTEDFSKYGPPQIMSQSIQTPMKNASFKFFKNNLIFEAKINASDLQYVYSTDSEFVNALSIISLNDTVISAVALDSVGVVSQKSIKLTGDIITSSVSLIRYENNTVIAGGSVSKSADIFYNTNVPDLNAVTEVKMKHAILKNDILEQYSNKVLQDIQYDNIEGTWIACYLISNNVNFYVSWEAFDDVIYAQQLYSAAGTKISPTDGYYNIDGNKIKDIDIYSKSYEVVSELTKDSDGKYYLAADSTTQLEVSNTDDIVQSTDEDGNTTYSLTETVTETKDGVQDDGSDEVGRASARTSTTQVYIVGDKLHVRTPSMTYSDTGEELGYSTSSYWKSGTIPSFSDLTYYNLESSGVEDAYNNVLEELNLFKDNIESIPNYSGLSSKSSLKSFVSSYKLLSYEEFKSQRSVNSSKTAYTAKIPLRKDSSGYVLDINANLSLDIIRTIPEDKNSTENTEAEYINYLYLLSRYVLGNIEGLELKAAAISKVMITNDSLLLLLKNYTILSVALSNLYSVSDIESVNNWSALSLPPYTTYAAVSDSDESTLAFESIRYSDNGTVKNIGNYEIVREKKIFTITNTYSYSNGKFVFFGGYYISKENFDKQIASVPGLSKDSDAYNGYTDYLMDNVSPFVAVTSDKQTLDIINVKSLIEENDDLKDTASNITSINFLYGKILCAIQYTYEGHAQIYKKMLIISFNDDGTVATEVGEDNGPVLGDIAEVQSQYKEEFIKQISTGGSVDTSTGDLISQYLSSTDTTVEQLANSNQDSINRQGDEIIYKSGSDTLVYLTLSGVSLSTDDLTVTQKTAEGFRLSSKLCTNPLLPDSEIRMLFALSTVNSVADQTKYINKTKINEYLTSTNDFRVPTVKEVDTYSTANLIYSYRNTILTAEELESSNNGYPTLDEDYNKVYYEYDSDSGEASSLTNFAGDTLSYCDETGTKVLISTGASFEDRTIESFKSFYDRLMNTYTLSTAYLPKYIEDDDKMLDMDFEGLIDASNVTSGCKIAGSSYISLDSSFEDITDNTVTSFFYRSDDATVLKEKIEENEDEFGTQNNPYETFDDRIETKTVNGIAYLYDKKMKCFPLNEVFYATVYLNVPYESKVQTSSYFNVPLTTVQKDGKTCLSTSIAVSSIDYRSYGILQSSDAEDPEAFKDELLYNCIGDKVFLYKDGQQTTEQARVPRYFSLQKLITDEGREVDLGHVTADESYESSFTAISEIEDEFLTFDKDILDGSLEHGHFYRIYFITLATQVLGTSIMNSSDYIVEIPKDEISIFTPDRVYFTPGGIPSPPFVENGTIQDAENGYAFKSTKYTNNNNLPIYICNSEGKLSRFVKDSNGTTQYEVLADGNDDLSTVVNYARDLRVNPNTPVYTTCEDWFRSEYYLDSNAKNPLWQILEISAKYDSKTRHYGSKTSYRKYVKSGTKMVMQEVDDSEAYCFFNKTTYSHTSGNTVIIKPNVDPVLSSEGKIVFLLTQNDTFKEDKDLITYGISYKTTLADKSIYDDNFKPCTFDTYFSATYSTDSTEDFTNKNNKDAAIQQVTEFALLDKNRRILAYALFPPIEYRTDSQHLSVTTVINKDNMVSN